MTYGAVEYGSGPFAGPQGVAASASGFPVVSLAIAFDSVPGAETPVWTEVSDDLRLSTTRRGRSRELERYQPGEAEFVLANHDRKYDPVYASSPYAGKILPMKRTRLQATYGGVTYPLFDGYIDSWEQVYEHPQEALAIVRCTDAMKVLAAALLPTSGYAAEVTSDEPIAWWRLGEPNDATMALDSVGDAHLTKTGTGVTFGQTSLVAREDDTAVKILDTTPESGFIRNGAALVTGPPVTVEVLFQWTGPGTDSGTLFGHISGFGGRGFVLGTNGVQAQFVVSVLSVTSVVITGTSDVSDGDVHHIVAVWDADGSMYLYVDGALEASGFSPVVAFPESAFVVIGGSDISGVSDDGPDGIYDEVALYDVALSATRIAAHAETVSTPWNNDSPGERVDRVLDLLDWPESLREIDPGKSVLQSVELDGSALEHLQKVAESEFGALFVTRDGKVRLVGREELVNTPNLATFGDGSGETEYTNLDFDFSDTDIRNDVVVSRREGVAQRVEDPDSIAAYLRHSYSVDGLLHDDDDLSRSAANLILSHYAEPALRVTELRLEPITAQPELFLEALERELTDTVTVRRRPQNLGSAIEQITTVEGVDHEIGDLIWKTTLRLSPAVAEEAGGFWQIGVVGHSEIGETTRVYM